MFKKEKLEKFKDARWSQLTRYCRCTYELCRVYRHKHDTVQHFPGLILWFSWPFQCQSVNMTVNSRWNVFTPTSAPTPPVNASSKAMHCSLSRQEWFAVCGVKFSHCCSCLGGTQCLDLKWPLDGQIYLHSSNDALISAEGVSATQSEQQEEKRGREEGRTSTSGWEKVFVGDAFMQH